MEQPPPRREVVGIRDRRGPRGGRLFIMSLSCGHVVWRRGGRPAKAVECVSCWLLENPALADEV